MLKRMAAVLGAGACVTAIAVAAPAPAHAQVMAYDIRPGSLRSALDAWARQSGRQVIYRLDEIRGARSPGARGPMSADDALAAVLQGTGFRSQADPSGAVAIVQGTSVSGEGEAGGAAADSGSAGGEGRPEILVTGTRISLNADIRRSQDGIQPYVVINQQAIERSGATNVEDLLRRTLTMQTQSLTRSQLEGSGAGNSTEIALRGLSANQTLILVDGRRLPARNDRGNANQPDLGGIPLLAIERIEVLPTTASGIYGGSATGGVVNIILRRDFRGAAIQGTYENVLEGSAATARIDASAGFSFNEGRTNFLIYGSYASSSPLRYSERDIVQRGAARAFANSPATFIASPPLGATTNIVSTTGANLTLKSVFGGGALNSLFTYVPFGYSGPASDNGAGLIANAGRLNFVLPNTAQPGGGRRYFLQTPESGSINATLRHEFSPGFAAFLEVAASRNDSIFEMGPIGGQTFTLTPANAGNPFNQTVRVTIPLFGTDGLARSRNELIRITLGSTFNLPFRWRGGVDYAWGRTRFASTSAAALLNGQQSTPIANGTINIFQDMAAAGTRFASYVGPDIQFGPGVTRLDLITARLSGPMGFRLPGGEPVTTIVLDHRSERLGAFELLNPPSAVQINNPRSQRADSIYAELLAPIVSPDNQVPFIHLLELQLAGRADWYNVTGSNTSVGTAAAVTQSTRFSSVNPTVGLRWQPARDITLRASYGRGFLPPSMSQLVPGTPAQALPSFFSIRGITDPQRGNEAIGTVTLQPGGNPDLRPETSESWSLGFILTPRFIPGFRFSADWTRIRKRDNINSSLNIQSFVSFLDSLAFAPERFTRDPDPGSFGAFPVGPIRAIDTTAINIARAEVEGIDFALDQSIPSPNAGEFVLTARATRAIHNITQLTPAATPLESVGTVSNLFWHGGATLTWNWRDLTVAWTATYYDDYYVSSLRTVSAPQGSDRVRSQLYNDLYVRYRFSVLNARSPTEVRLNIRNIFNRAPAFDAAQGAGAGAGYYSTWGDPRGTNYSVSLLQNF